MTMQLAQAKSNVSDGLRHKILLEQPTVLRHVAVALVSSRVRHLVI